MSDSESESFGQKSSLGHTTFERRLAIMVQKIRVLKMSRSKRGKWSKVAYGPPFGVTLLALDQSLLRLVVRVIMEKASGSQNRETGQTL
jgi:hypothetical protein